MPGTTTGTFSGKAAKVTVLVCTAERALGGR
jgi:hypothetical protein